MEFVTSVKEWLNLAKLDIPVVKDENDTGRVYRVLKVGMFLADPDDCEKHDVAAVPNPTGKCTLPTCVIEESGHGRRLCQLPLDLAGWAEDVVGAAHLGAKLFPCDMELGLLRDRIYAEML